MSSRKILSACIFVLFISSVTAFFFIDGYISSYSSPYLTGRIEELPFNRCGLLLGTSKYRAEGGINPFFAKRLDAAADLYRAGKIDCIIASGDNSMKM